MTVNHQKFPPCFGKMETVFPVGECGLREVPESCMLCCYKTGCLRTAVNNDESRTIEQENTDRAYSSGRISFFERWSRKKSMIKR